MIIQINAVFFRVTEMIEIEILMYMLISVCLRGGPI